jgi:hypothetical protein
MQFIAANFVQTTLSAAATSTDTSLSITSATGIPALVDGQALPITLINAATQTVYEICYITAISGTTITVLRGQEGTVAQSWSIGDLVKSCRTSGTTGSVVGTLVPAGSFTLPAGTSRTLVLTDSITADSTFTLPAAPLAGTGFTVFGSASAYTTTVASPVTSGSPYIEMPDGSQVYSYVIPASSPGAGIRIVWDGTNYRATTFGQTIVAPGTANNEAVNLGQVKNAVAPVAAYANPGSGTTNAAIATTGTLTAPCDGYAIVIASFSSTSASLTGTGVTASLAGLVEIMNPNNGNYFNQSVWYLPMTAEQSSTFTATLSQSTSGASTVTCVATFQPNPGT